MVWVAKKMGLQSRYAPTYMCPVILCAIASSSVPGIWGGAEYIHIFFHPLKVRLDTSYGLLGVGKATEYDKQSVDATKQRKRMEVEVQQAETDHERKMREEKVEREKETKAQVMIDGVTLTHFD